MGNINSNQESCIHAMPDPHPLVPQGVNKEANESNNDFSDLIYVIIRVGGIIIVIKILNDFFFKTKK